MLVCFCFAFPTEAPINYKNKAGRFHDALQRLELSRRRLQICQKMDISAFRRHQKKKGGEKAFGPSAHLPCMRGRSLQAIRFTAASRLRCSCGDRFFSIRSSPQLPAPLQEQMSRRSATIHPNSSLGGQSRRRGLCHCHEKWTFVMSRRIIWKRSVAGSKRTLICCTAVRGWGGRRDGMEE